MSTWTDQNLIFLNLPTDQFLAILAYGEAGNQGGEGMMAVLNVVRNRTMDGSFYDQEIMNLTGDAYKAVGLKSSQFSMFNLNNSVRPIAERIAGNFAGEVSSNSILAQAYELAQMMIQGNLADNTGGSQYYHASYVTPSWASVIPFIGQIGDQLFYGSGVSAATSGVGSIIEAGLGSNITIMILIGIGIGVVIKIIKRRK
jgi:spore germination cell wall hydrolase CwlJ-like protein